MKPQALLVAIQFLTRWPLRLRADPSPRDLGNSLLWYPLVGALIGGALMIAALPPIAAPLHAALLLAFWVAISGGLHLDGLADCADAWVGGHGDRARTLRIMKDPACGPIGVTAVVLLLLLKFAALQTLLTQHQAHALWLPPLLARAAMPALFASTPYVRDAGLGSPLSENLSPRAAALVVTASLPPALLAGGPGLLASLFSVATFAALRRSFQARLGGFTGDCAGATIEVIELAALLALALAP